MAEPGKDTDTELAEIATFGYERARDELVNVVKMLEQGGLDLDESLTLWERGEALANRCEEHLAGARKRVEDALSRTDLEDEK
ncbi:MULTISPECIES: exodeoxyribonuclease VII small subunit [Nocardia]|uniref:Exodeoxyribonuclease 7 small subunit n=2 Tax=Nocardia TaxID=1817 RepID=K0FCA6_NOCB7|nr:MULTISPECIES: exodeoxyribonuclease VII small subunit [Nocardia]AFU05191.1 exodeoxyribonuclease VII small subunit [Nocardia brasiliensis ATCC 700358]ASF11788.1 exodeoxyribonuclease VII small subunit [Nocardia brasiliensis]KIA65734.1 exodeoxyribonuclease VII small subunit [Nocardia vulneris]OCF88076.1 exodeoxyribonuclease VII small subunit [Nocardia brasiliensis]SUB09382.1 exodeoxyribonuclease VII small subunit [Nocardia brasiliensis]